MANECRSMCGDTAEVMPARSAASCSTCHALWRDSRPPRALRKIAGGAAPAAGQLRSPAHEVGVQRGDRRSADRHQPLLAALAAQQHRPGLGVDVVDVEADGFGDSRPGGVQQFEQRPVAQRQRAVGLAVAAGAVQQREHLVDG